MAMLFLSFFAGVLTVLAPCILPVLPIIIGRSLGTEKKHRPFVIVGSLAIAVVVFTLILKASTVFIHVPQSFWTYISGIIIIIFGLISLFPTAWEKISERLRFSSSSNTLLQKSSEHKGIFGDILIGLSLGPVFSSCSPTYFLILATVLPQSYATGFVYLTAYALGLSSILLLVSIIGQKLVKHLHGVASPTGWFKRSLGVLFVLVGIGILTGADKYIQTSLLENGFFDVTKIEQRIMRITDATTDQKNEIVPYTELAGIAGYVNTEPFTLRDYVGKKVILLDFLTYSCINCQRTFPYLSAWQTTYEDDGLIIIGVHTPEFAFEQDIENVKNAAQQLGLHFPIVLDNTYQTWQAYENHYWPHKYLIDIHGNIVYDHIGEGAYDETEQIIRNLLLERKNVLGEQGDIAPPTSQNKVNESATQKTKISPETYFGTRRNSYRGVIASTEGDIVTFSEPASVRANTIYLVGTWKITDEYVEALSHDAKILYSYQAKNVFLVMGSENNATVTITQDGKLVANNKNSVAPLGTFTITDERLYTIIENNENTSHLLELFVAPGGRAYAFTFGS